MPAKPKMSKLEADYQSVSGARERCGLCVMFRMIDRCTAVEGSISPRGLCRLYEPALKAGRSPFASSSQHE